MTLPVTATVSMQWQCSTCGVVGNDYLGDLPFGASVIFATHTCGTNSHVPAPDAPAISLVPPIGDQTS